MSHNEQSSHKIGVVVANVMAGCYDVFCKNYKQFVRTFRSNKHFHIGQLVKIENDLKILSMSPKEIDNDWSKCFTKPGELLFTLKNITIDFQNFTNSGFFSHNILGEVEDKERKLKYSAYESITVEQTQQNGRFYWKVIDCVEFNENTIGFFMAKKDSRNKFFERADPQTVERQLLLEQSLNAPLLDEDNGCDSFDEFEDSEEVKKINEKLQRIQIQKKNSDDPKLMSSTRFLNIEQVKIVRKSLNENCKILIIEGGPGTGKTIVLAKIIYEWSLRRMKILVLLPTDEAKNIIIGLFKNESGPNEIHIDSESFRKRKQKVDSYKETMKLETRLRSKRLKDEDRKDLEDQVLEKKRKTLETLMTNIRIVFARIDDNDFMEMIQLNGDLVPNVVVVDECGQLNEKQLLPKAIHSQRLILAGDVKQLPSFYSSGGAKMKVVSILETLRQKELYSNHMMLKVQYRCNKEIATFFSNVFYNGEIQTHKTVADASFKDIAWNDSLMRNTPLNQNFRSVVFCDTGRSKNVRTYEQLMDGYYVNEGEAKLIVAQIRNLQYVGIPLKAITVMTPFRSQRNLLRDELIQLFPQQGHKHQVEVDTVHAFQGQRRDIVLFSMGRNNPLGEFGFSEMASFINFAMSRAICHFFIVGNTFMLKNKPELEPLLNMFNNREICSIVTPAMVVGRETGNTGMVRNCFGPNYRWFKEHCKDGYMLRRMREEGL